MHTARSHRQLWQRCRHLVDGLVLPTPFDAETFIGMLAESRGRPIDLVPVTARPHIPCGLLVTTDRADCILYTADTTLLHRQHILLHEAAHLLCGHHETSPSASAAAQMLLPNLPASLIRRVLGRSVYTEPQEAEAELVASLILNRAARMVRAGGAVPPPDGAGDILLRSLFGTPDQRGQEDRARDGRAHD
ncbi:ParH-like protein [Streptomyces sp. NBC_01476]|uniref:ParH-like protein n=1 Tax=Streptomyces sp. NBC_01476 TaxID=2903881 RepID=UPI002E338D2F|nr:ParH-like protein [Streptomyces sp. NBC_01476]